jgi:hypothetical protein
VAGLSEPQGLAYLPAVDQLAVASGDGVVRFYRGSDLAPAGEVKVGADADNLRVDGAGRLVVGYGDGALAVIEPSDRRIVSTAQLDAHPEGFRLDLERGRAFVNLPGRGALATVDLASGRVLRSDRAAYAAAYPLQYDKASNRVSVVYRVPARLVVTDADTGKRLQDVSVCGDADDLFVDSRRLRVYVSCGSGAVDVFEASDPRYRRLARIKTRKGARTSLFVPELDRLFVAARAGGGQPAAILEFSPRG